MRIFKLAIPLLCILSLSACSSTWHGLKKDLQENTTPISGNRPHMFEFDLPDAPGGYSGQNRHGLLLKPPGAAGSGPVYADANGRAWHEIGSYDTAEIAPGTVEVDLSPITGKEKGLELTAPGAGNVESYNDAVQVFSLDGAVGNGAVYASGYGAPPRYAASSSMYGPPQAEVFFAHGSSIVKKSDKAKLKKLASRVKRKGDVSVTVVGHASRRVDGVHDPVKREMINFAMAQKRADAVMHELNRAGLRPGWVQAVSKGDEEPNPNRRDMPQEVADRRAEVYMDER